MEVTITMPNNTLMTAKEPKKTMVTEVGEGNTAKVRLLLLDVFYVSSLAWRWGGSIYHLEHSSQFRWPVIVNVERNFMNWNCRAFIWHCLSKCDNDQTLIGSV